MNISKTLKILLLTAALFTSSLNAEESNKPSCDELYDICIEKCNKTENSSEACYNTCDEEYNKCLDSTQDSKTEGK